MNFPKAESFPVDIVRAKIMGPNPLKLTEEMLEVAARVTGCTPAIEPGSVVLDLGCGRGITSAMLVREYSLAVCAADLWVEPSDNMRFFDQLGLSNRQIAPVKVDVTQGMPFAHGFFDAVVSCDSYHYFGRDPEFLDEKLAPFVKSGGLIVVSIPGMVRDCHDDLPSCLLESWSADDMEYMHDAAWWAHMIERSSGAELVAIEEMACTEEAWTDWLECDDDYARGDRAAIEAGALEYLNSLAIVMRKR